MSAGEQAAPQGAPAPAPAPVGARKDWDQIFDRRVSLVLVDYTDMALGLGEAKAAIICAWVDSGGVSSQAQAQTRMGLSLAATSIKGACGDESMPVLARFMNHALLAQRAQSIRYLDPHLRDRGAGLCELALLAKAQMGTREESKAFAKLGREDLRRLLTIFGLTHMAISAPLWVSSDTMSLSNPLSHPMWAEWVEKAKASAVRERDMR